MRIESMDALKVGMKHTMEWVVDEKLTTQRGGLRVFSTPSMNRRGQVHRAVEKEDRGLISRRWTPLNQN
jgi:hypothetical protein